MDQEIFSIIRLARSSGVGHVTYRELIKKYKTAKLAIDNFKDFISEYRLQNRVKLATTDEINDEIAKLSQLKGQIITYKDANYPSMLKQITDFPIVISVIGNAQLLNKTCVAIVGSRNASANGYRYSYMLAKQAVERDFVVVSGLARGIDTAAHQGAMPQTIACLAGGVDYVYPPENQKLYDETSEKGLIVSEMSLGTIPKATNFPMRNRIISGLSESVIVVEAAINSGSLITAKFALEQNRDIYAVPSFPGDLRARGTIKLLKEGAYLIENFNDYRSEKLAKRQIYIDDKELIEDNDDDSAFDKSDITKIIMQQINSSPVSIDEIVAITSLSTNMVLSELSKLELEGKVFRQNGNKVVLIK